MVRLQKSISSRARSSPPALGCVLLAIPLAIFLVLWFVSGTGKSQSPWIFVVGAFALLVVVVGLAALSKQARPDAADDIAESSKAFPVEPSDGAVVLERFSKHAPLWFLFLFAVMWNGILIGVFTLSANRPPLLFILPFVLVGVALIVWIAYTALARTNPVPQLTMSTGRPRLGEEVELEWKLLGGTDRVRKLTIHLEGVESAAYRQGTTTHTSHNVFCSIALAETSKWDVIARGDAAVLLPADAVPSWDGGNNKILWRFHVRGEIPFWPDVDDYFGITVYPRGHRDS